MFLTILACIKIFLCITLLANTSIVLMGQNESPIENTTQSTKTGLDVPKPSAIPVLTPEESEMANQEAIAHLEAIREAEEKRSNEIAYAISHRKKHQFYKSIAFLLIIIIHISFIGYINYFRRKFKIHWTNVIMFGACVLAIIMMAMGMLHFMKPAAYLICLGGLILAVYETFYINKNWSIPSFAVIQRTYLRPEYVFMLCASLGSFLVFTGYQVEMGQGDVWTAWYHQYIYIVKNGCWADSGYKNYASAYAMIINGLSSYFAFLLHNYGTQVWTWSHLWFCIMMLMPLFRTVKWKNTLQYEVMALSFFLLFYRLFSKKPSNLFLYCFFLTFLFFIRQVLRSKKKLLFLSNSLVLFWGVVLSFYVISNPVSFFDYPMDSVLGVATIGVVFSFFWKLLKFGTFNWYIFLYAIPLIVLSLIKPTGVIPALMISICFAFGVVYYVLKYFRSSNKKNKIIVMATLSLLVVVSAPLVTNSLWNAYASFHNLKYQHSVSAGQLISKAISQIRYGCNEEELEIWQKRLGSISIVQNDVLFDHDNKEKKSFFEKNLETLFKNIFAEYPLLDFDKRFANPIRGKSHVAIVSFMLLLSSVACLFVCKKRSVVFYLICWTILTYFVFVVNQYYLGPMFTNIPGLFRYFYPAYTIILGLTFCGLFWVFDKSKLIWGFLISFYLFFSLSAHFYSSIVSSLDSYKDSSQSWIGYIILAQRNADQENKIHFANPWGEGCASHSLSLVFPEIAKHFMPWHLPRQINDKSFLEIVVSRMISSNWKYQAVNESGMYLAIPNNETNIINLSPFFCNKDALSLLNEMYYLSDLNSWNCPPWIEKSLVDINENKWSIPSGNKCIKEKTNKVIINPMEKKYTLWDTTYKFCFAQDSIRFVGTYSKGMNFSVVLGLYEKSDADQQYRGIKQKQMTIQTSSLNKKEFEFKADLNLADIPNDKLNLYYRIGIVFEPGTEGEMRDFHLYQYVSGKLNLKQALAELEQSEQSVQFEQSEQSDKQDNSTK